MNPISRNMLLGIGAGVTLALPTGMMLGSFTTSNMRNDFAYGYDMPDPQAIAQAQQDRDDSYDLAEYEPPRPKQFGQDAVFHATVNGDEAPSFESVYYPDDSPGN